MLTEKNIILFDGICNLCHGGVQFIIKRDKKQLFKFVALQSDIGKNLLSEYGIDVSKTDSFVYIKYNKAYIKSTATLKIAKDLKRGWQLFYIFIIIPPFIRNWLYDIIAKNRYKWFGKKESCLIPTQDLKARFLE